ncbi:unnamed protein product [Pneumocystis jirovecii]|uniref:U3 small nucleolar RNA-associated protein 15 C-terminal domain-containing protein n=1 Tax=Pneumocystis jirovecii TaxID=42068 RepID=L0PBH8_PNEJI|nr:unnamed protein product [Pneumocystis jirovecii]
MEAPRLALAKLPSGPAPITAEQRYWRGFKEIASVSHIHFCAKDPHDFAVTSSARVQIYSSQTCRVKKSIARFKDTAYCGEIRQDGRILIAGDAGGTVQLFDTATRSILKSLYSHKLAVHVTKFSPCRQTVFLSGSDDKTIRIWDLTECIETCVLEGNEDYIRAAEFLYTSDVVLSGGYDGTVRLWDTRIGGDKREIKRFQHGDSVDAVVSLKEGSIILSAGGPVIKIWDVVGGRERALKIIQKHQKNVMCLIRNKEGSRVLSGGLDRHVKIYDVKDWKTVHSIKYAGAVVSLGISPDNKHLAVGMVSGVLSIRSRETGKRVPERTERIGERKGREKVDKAEGIEEIDLFGVLDGTGSVLYRERGDKKEKKGGEMLVIEEEKRKKLREYDKALKSFRYGDALDMVVEKEKAAIVIYTMINELKHRQGLRQALENRDDISLEPILRWLIRYLGNPRYREVDWKLTFIDLYGAALGHSVLIQNLLMRLSKRVSQEIEYCKEAYSCSGMLEMLFRENQGI